MQGVLSGELQSPRPRGQVHVFGFRSCGEIDALLPKNGPDPDFAVLLGGQPGGRANRRKSFKLGRRHVTSSKRTAFFWGWIW